MVSPGRERFARRRRGGTCRPRPASPSYHLPTCLCQGEAYRRSAVTPVPGVTVLRWYWHVGRAYPPEADEPKPAESPRGRGSHEAGIEPAPSATLRAGSERCGACAVPECSCAAPAKGIPALQSEVAPTFRSHTPRSRSSVFRGMARLVGVGLLADPSCGGTFGRADREIGPYAIVRDRHPSAKNGGPAPRSRSLDTAQAEWYSRHIFTFGGPAIASRFGET